MEDNITMTKKKVISLLKVNGIPANCQDYKYYEIAKGMIFEGKVWRQDEYERILKWVTDYLDV